MGNLTPGATLIYEREDGKTYAREVGSKDRILIGYEYDHKSYTYNQFVTDTKEDKLWNEIRIASKTNPSLQEAIDRVKIIYELSKNNE